VVVNGRWVQPRGLLACVEAAYRPLLPRGRHPVLVLVLEVAPAQVDVNLHPSKQEVRLREEQVLGRAAGELLRGALGGRPHPLELCAPARLESLVPAEAVLAGVDAEAQPILTPGLPPLRLVGQVQERLVLLEGPEGLYLVDQHRAHERILYEHLKAAHGGGGGGPVPLAVPLLLELSPAQALHFSRRVEELAALGFECEAFGGRAFLLRAAPLLPGVVPGAEEGLCGLGEPEALARTLLSLVEEEAGEGESWQERLLTRLACRTAVRRGKSLERPLLRALVTALGHTRTPAVCPHGSPLLLHVSGALLERQFDWR
jgi:DNA mismatch repair protein MutL